MTLYWGTNLKMSLTPSKNQTKTKTGSKNKHLLNPVKWQTKSNKVVTVNTLITEEEEEEEQLKCQVSGRTKCKHSFISVQKTQTSLLVF